MLSTKDEVIANGYEMVDLLFDTSELEAEQATLLEETQLISDMVQQAFTEMSTSPSTKRNTRNAMTA